MTKKNNQLSIIVFSKDRPLQLEGYLASLLYFSDINPEDITVLYKDNAEINYTRLTHDFKNINWVREKKFIDDLTRIIEISSEYIMFGCDDVIFKDFFDKNYALNRLSNNQNLFGFSLRLGKNISPYPKQISTTDSIHMEWKWKETNLSSWNYPWELDSTIYRKEDISKIMSKLDLRKIKNPNFFESEIASAPDIYVSRDYLACFALSKSLVLTVNRVQETFKNEFDNSLATDIHSLNDLYKEGGKIDFLKISKKNNRKIHVGAEYFKITGSEKYNNPITVYTNFFIRKFINLLKRFK